MLHAQRWRIFVIRVVIATLAMIACGFAAGYLPTLWSGVSGRDFRPWGATLAILIFLLAVFLRGCLKWEGAVFAGSLICVEIFALCVISHYTGFVWWEIFEPFNLQWLLTMNVFFAAPWAFGVMAGSLWLALRRRLTGRY